MTSRQARTRGCRHPSAVAAAAARRMPLTGVRCCGCCLVECFVAQAALYCATAGSADVTRHHSSASGMQAWNDGLWMRMHWLCLSECCRFQLQVCWAVHTCGAWGGGCAGYDWCISLFSLFIVHPVATHGAAPTLFCTSSIAAPCPVQCLCVLRWGVFACCFDLWFHLSA